LRYSEYLIEDYAIRQGGKSSSMISRCYEQIDINLPLEKALKWAECPTGRANPEA
jgi:hypothetical protein